jgi:hypothetical protein
VTAPDAIDVAFPVRGVDVAGAPFAEPRPGTTPVGVNVRAFDTGGVVRGGSRPGQSKYLLDQLPHSYTNGPRVVQHLDFIVDPTVDALIENPTTFDWPQDPSTVGPPDSWPTNPPGDTRNPGNPVPPGGNLIPPDKTQKKTPIINWSDPADMSNGAMLSGTQLDATATAPGGGGSVAGSFLYSPPSGTVMLTGNHQALHTTFTPTTTTLYNTASKTVHVNVTESASWFFVQGQYFTDVSPTNPSYVLDVPVTDGNFLVVAIWQSYLDLTFPGVSSVAGFTLAKRQTVTYEPNVGNPNQKSELSVWYLSGATASDTTVNITVDVNGPFLVYVIEYQPVHPTVAPVDTKSASAFSDTGFGTTTAQTADVTALAGDLVVGVVGAGVSNQTGVQAAPTTAYTLREDGHPIASDDLGYADIVAAGNDHPVWTLTGGTPSDAVNQWVAITVSFRGS